jgi:hypothetical protein
VIHGAVLALDAQEYLGHRTPTTSLEAISQKHHLEVLAECMFYGVEYNMDMKSRFEEIKREIRSVGGWFRPRTRRQSMLNAEIRILSELVLTYRNYNQFDEEQSCLARLRNAYRHLWYQRRKAWAWLFYPARWYVDFLLVSLLRFGLAITFWIFLVGTLYNLLMNSPKDDPMPAEMWHGYADSMVSFFGLQPPHEMAELYPGGAIWVCMAAILLGFVHLGIFISHLYSMMARR